MCSAFTTAAVVNYSLARPEDGVSPLDYMPSHKQHIAPKPELTEEQLDEQSDFNIAVLAMAIKMRADAAAKRSATWMTDSPT